MLFFMALERVFSWMGAVWHGACVWFKWEEIVGALPTAEVELGSDDPAREVVHAFRVAWLRGAVLLGFGAPEALSSVCLPLDVLNRISY